MNLNKETVPIDSDTIMSASLVREREQEGAIVSCVLESNCANGLDPIALVFFLGPRKPPSHS